MRIAFSGTANSGKTTLLKSFLYTWSNFSTPEKTYRDMLAEKELNHSSSTTTETQSQVMDFMVDQLIENSKDDCVVYDRCPLDSVAYTLWCNDKNKDGFTREFVTEQITLCKESLRNLDIIFLCKFDEKEGVKEDGSREADLQYIKEVDNIFESLYQQYMQNPQADVFYPKDDSPAVILLPNGIQERIDLLAEYITPEGGMYGDEHSILNPDNLNELEALVKQQQSALDKETKEKELFAKFGIKDDDRGSNYNLQP